MFVSPLPQPGKVRVRGSDPVCKAVCLTVAYWAATSCRAGLSVILVRALSFELCALQPAGYPSDEERAAMRRQQQKEDDMDAELIVNVGFSHP